MPRKERSCTDGKKASVFRAIEDEVFLEFFHRRDVLELFIDRLDPNAVRATAA